MPRRTYAFAHEDGRISKRTSEKEYTHAVVGCRDLAGMRGAVLHSTEFHRQTWDGMRRRADDGVGNEWQSPGRGRLYVVSMHDFKEARQFLQQYPTADAYIEFKVAEVGEGDEGDEEVLQWSQTERAAKAALGRYLARYRNVRVVEVRAI